MIIKAKKIRTTFVVCLGLLRIFWKIESEEDFSVTTFADLTDGAAAVIVGASV